MRRGSSMSSVDKHMSFRPSVVKSNTGDECSGCSSTRGVVRRGSSMSCVDKYMSIRPSVGLPNTRLVLGYNRKSHGFHPLRTGHGSKR